MRFWSHSYPRFFFVRQAYRLLWCYGCGRRMAWDLAGVLTPEGRRIQWACFECYLKAYLRAES